MKTLSGESKRLIQDACRRLTGFNRRAYQAEITREYFHGSARQAEREMGWGRESVQKGLKEAESGLRCLDHYQGRGRRRTEERMPGLTEDIRTLAEPQTQADPAMKSSLTYTRVTGKAVREALISEKGYRDEDLPTANTIGTILNRLGYNLKRVLKSKPQKKSRRETRSLKMCGRRTGARMRILSRFAFLSMPKRKCLSENFRETGNHEIERRKKPPIMT